MTNIFPSAFVEKVTPADNDKILLSDSTDGDKIKYGRFVNFKGAKGDTGANGNGIANITTNKVGKTTTVTITEDDSTVKSFNIQDGSDGNGIANITTNKVGKTTTVTITEDNSTVKSFNIQDGADGSGTGDMLKSTYDPTNKSADAFSMDNMVETATKKILTASERTTLSNTSNINTGDETQATIKNKLGAATASSDGYATSTQITKLDGIATGATANTKAIGSEIDVGTDDVKFATAKAIADSGITQNTKTQTLTNKTINDGKFIQSINAQTGTTYTLTITDSSKLITLSNASAITVTIPTNASVAFPIGCQIDLVQTGAGKVTIGGNGVTINSKGGLKSTNGQWVGVSLVKTDTDTWLLVGDLVS